MQFDCTITFIIQQDGEHFAEYDYLQQSILKVKKNDRVRYLIFYYDQLTKFAWIKQYVSERNKRFLKIIKPPFPVSNFHDGVAIENFIKDHVVSERSEKNIVIIWGHGSGLGFFSPVSFDNWQTDYLDSLRKNNLDDTYNKIVFNRKVAQIIQLSAGLGANDIFSSNPVQFTDKDGNNISNASAWEELKKNGVLNYISAQRMAEIFTNVGFKENSKLDLLICSACFTAILESLCHFESCTKLFVGPQTTFPFVSYDFDHLFRSIEKDSEKINFELLITQLVKSFRKKYRKQPFISLVDKYFFDTATAGSKPTRFDLGFVSLTAVNLESFTGDVSRLLDEIGEYLLTNYALDKLETAREQTIITTKLDQDDDNGLDAVIDLINFLLHYSKLEKSKAFNLLVRSLLNGTIKNNKIMKSHLNSRSNPGKPYFINFFMPNGDYAETGPGKTIRQMQEISYGENSLMSQKFKVWSKLINKRFAEEYP